MLTETSNLGTWVPSGNGIPILIVDDELAQETLWVDSAQWQFSTYFH
ncbi:MAG: hypothetical protein AAF959_27435 [Cyanobacteria bacterium P01_D01_bin.56]